MPLTPSSSVVSINDDRASALNDGASASSSSVSDSIRIPEHWRPEVEKCINVRCLTDTARSEIVRVIVTQLFARSRKPSRDECDCHARKLILKYPFMRDDMGNGCVSNSWS